MSERRNIVKEHVRRLAVVRWALYVEILRFTQDDKLTAYVYLVILNEVKDLTTKIELKLVTSPDRGICLSPKWH